MFLILFVQNFKGKVHKLLLGCLGVHILNLELFTNIWIRLGNEVDVLENEAFKKVRASACVPLKDGSYRGLGFHLHLGKFL